MANATLLCLRALCVCVCACVSRPRPRYNRYKWRKNLFIARAISMCVCAQRRTYVCALCAFKQDLGSWADFHKSLPLLPNHLMKNSTICFDTVRRYWLLPPPLLLLFSIDCVCFYDFSLPISLSLVDKVRSIKTSRVNAEQKKINK